MLLLQQSERDMEAGVFSMSGLADSLPMEDEAFPVRAPDLAVELVYTLSLCLSALVSCYVLL